MAGDFRDHLDVRSSPGKNELIYAAHVAARQLNQRLDARAFVLLAFVEGNDDTHGSDS
jgi:hypothetical protein